MKKITLFTLLFVGVFLSNCQKESFKSNEQKQETTNASSNQQPVDLFKPKDSNKPTLKSIDIPDFDLENSTVSYSGNSGTRVTTFFEADYGIGDNDFWAMHEFQVEDSPLQMIYHHIKDGSTAYSEVYNLEGKYQFTFIDVNGTVSIEEDYSNNPQGMNEDFLGCLRWYIGNSYTEWAIIVGAPVIVYWVNYCYKKYVR